MSHAVQQPRSGLRERFVRLLAPCLAAALLLLGGACNGHLADRSNPGTLPPASVRDSERDILAIRAQLSKIETAVRETNVAVSARLYGSVYSENGSYINTHGARVFGREAIMREFAAEDAGPAPPPGVAFKLSVIKIDFVKPDIAIVDCDGEPFGIRATYVMVKQKDQWLVHAGRILEGPEPKKSD